MRIKSTISSGKQHFSGKNIWQSCCLSTLRCTDSVSLLAMSTLQGLEDRYYVFHFDSFLISSLIMLCSVPHMITSLVKQWFSQSFSPRNNKSEATYENATITKDVGTKYLAAQKRFMKKKKAMEKDVGCLSPGKKRGPFNNSEQSLSL